MRAWFPSEARPALVLAPMQDVTHHAFLALMARYGGPDWYVTEYFRVYPGSRPDRHILRCLEENPTGRPVVAQMVGRDAADLVRTARQLEARGAAGIDLNLGCPAAVVCRKHAGGALLRDPARIDHLLAALREAVQGPLTVKTRIGFASADEFPRLLGVFARHSLDGVVVHGRTVRDGYRTPVDSAAIRRAVECLDCPVVANGNVVSARTALALQRRTGAAGVMVGRGAIRNPWIFRQIAALAAGREPVRPTFRDLLEYVLLLWGAVTLPGTREAGMVAAMKKYMNFVADGIDEEGAFLHGVRRAATAGEFHDLCARFLDRDGFPPDEPPVSSSSFRGFDALREEEAG